MEKGKKNRPWNSDFDARPTWAIKKVLGPGEKYASAVASHLRTVPQTRPYILCIFSLGEGEGDFLIDCPDGRMLMGNRD